MCVNICVIFIEVVKSVIMQNAIYAYKKDTVLDSLKKLYLLLFLKGKLKKINTNVRTALNWIVVMNIFTSGDSKAYFIETKPKIK